MNSCSRFLQVKRSIGRVPFPLLSRIFHACSSPTPALSSFALAHAQTTPDTANEQVRTLETVEAHGVVNQADLTGTLKTGGVIHSFTAGLELSRDRLYDRSMSVNIRSERDSLWNLQVPNKRFDDFTITYGNKVRVAEIDTRSLYLFDSMELSEQFPINTGTRFENYEVSDSVRSLQRKDDLFNWQWGWCGNRLQAAVHILTIAPRPV